MTALRRSGAERALAWLYTGPAGHLWSVSADLVVIWPRYVLAALLRRDAGPRA